MIPFHCKRGHRGCNRCKVLFEEGEKYCVLELIKDHEEYPVARPVIEIVHKGEIQFFEYDFVGCYQTKQLAVDANQDKTIDFDPKI